MPVIGAVILLFVPKKYTGIIKTSALYISLLVLILSLYWAAFHNLTIYTPETFMEDKISILSISPDDVSIVGRIIIGSTITLITLVNSSECNNELFHPIESIDVIPFEYICGIYLLI